MHLTLVIHLRHYHHLRYRFDEFRFRHTNTFQRFALCAGIGIYRGDIKFAKYGAALLVLNERQNEFAQRPVRRKCAKFKFG